MVKKVIGSGAIGPYSPAVKIGNLLFVSGQIPLNQAKGGILEDGIEQQAWQAMKNVQTLLQQAGGGLQDVVKTTVFLTNLEDFAVANQIYSEFFSEPFPARSCVEVNRLPKNVLIEVEAIAVLEDKKSKKKDA